MRVWPDIFTVHQIVWMGFWSFYDWTHTNIVRLRHTHTRSPACPNGLLLLITLSTNIKSERTPFRWFENESDRFAQTNESNARMATVDRLAAHGLRLQPGSVWLLLSSESSTPKDSPKPTIPRPRRWWSVSFGFQTLRKLAPQFDCQFYKRN